MRQARRSRLIDVDGGARALPNCSQLTLLEPESIFQQSELGAVWQRPGASVYVYQTTSAGLPHFHHRPGFHGIQVVSDAGNTPEHQVLAATHKGDTLRFLTILYPQRTGRGEPVVTLLSPARGSALLLIENNENSASCRTLLATQEKSGASLLSVPEFGELVYDGSFVLFALAPLHELPHIFYG